MTRIENSLVVIAHLSEGIPRHWLLDNTSLEAFLSSELEFGLAQAVETKALADINGTSGIQTQAYATSVLTTLRKASRNSRPPATQRPRSYSPDRLGGCRARTDQSNAVEHLRCPTIRRRGGSSASR